MNLRSFLRKYGLILGWPVCLLLTLSGTLRPEAMRLLLVAGGARDADAREARQITLERLYNAARPGDTVSLVTFGPPLDLALPSRGAILLRKDLPGGERDTALEAAIGDSIQTGQADCPTLLVVLDDDSSPALSAASFRRLPEGTHIRLVGARVSRSLAAFQAELSPHFDLRLASGARASEALAELIREMQRTRRVRATLATGIVLGGHLLAGALILLRRLHRRRRPLHILWETEGDLQAIPLAEGEAIQIGGYSLRRENGVVHLVPHSSSGCSEERWLHPGERADLNREASSIRLSVVNS